MHRRLSLSMTFALVACASQPGANHMFSSSDFEHLQFLEGRWQGAAPDGTPFFERYSFPAPGEMRSERFPDATFTESSDGSSVKLDNGRVTSTWNAFTWKASELSPGRACFEPVNAPSAFCWQRLSDTEVEMTQRWTGEDGKPQQYVVPLRRLPQ